MKKIEAYQGLDGKIYAGEEAVREGDEKWIVEKIARELETLYANKSKDGQPTVVFAIYRGAVREIYERYEKKLKSD